MTSVMTELKQVKPIKGIVTDKWFLNLTKSPMVICQSGDMIYSKHAKFNVGDKVRISKYKRKVFDKGFTEGWTEEASHCNPKLLNLDAQP